MSDIRFLFFLYYYPPVPGTAAKRNFRISDAIVRRADNSTVLTSSQVSNDPVPQGNLKLKTIPALDYRAYLRRKTKDGALPEVIKKSASAQWLIRLVNSFPFNIIAGEGGLVYFLNLITHGQRIIRKEKITHLYSSFRPFTDHYAAYWLKKRNPQLFWIADFRDLIIDPHYGHILFQRSHHQLFSKMFSIADVLTTVSDGLAAKLRDYNANVIVLRNGISGKWVAAKSVHTSFFTITYTGSMFLDKRNPEPLFQALQELMQESKVDGNDLQIRYAGKDGILWKRLSEKYYFESLLMDMGIVPDEVAKALQYESCINLLLTISSDQLQGVLTGKMIEYFEAGSPVLGIVVNQNDHELQSLLHEIEIGDSFSDQPDDLEGIKDFIYREYLQWKETGMNRKAVNTGILKKKYAQEVTMEPLFDQIFKTGNVDS